MAQNAQLSHLLGRRAVPAIAAIVVISVVFMAGLLVRIAGEQDSQAAETAQQLVSAALTRQRETMARSIKDYAAWGEAYQHLHLRTDVEWAYAQQNLGPTLYSDLSIDDLLVVGPAGAVTYAVVGGNLVGTPGPDILVPQLQTLVERARSVAPNESKPAVSYIETAHGPMLAAATVITTGGDPTIGQAAGPPSVLVFADQLTPPRLEEIGRDAFVHGLSFAGVAAQPTEHPSVTVPSVDAGQALTFRWTEQRPGHLLLVDVLPWVAVVGIAFALLIVTILRRAVDAARLIEENALALAEAHRVAEFSALHDPLTLLPNRVMLGRYLGQCFRTDGEQAPVALLFIDLDRFKPINDGFGHEVGDSVLRKTAARLQRFAGRDALVARVGGDEFVLGVPAGSKDLEVERLCRNLIGAITAPIRVGGAQLEVGLSIGVAMAPGDGDTPEQLVRHADIAMYQAKQEGGNTYRLFSSEMAKRISGRLGLECDIRRAIAAEEFVLDYQPRYRTTTLDLLGVEALVRWRHPVRGLLWPGEFIELAEESGAIVPLGEWVLRRACFTLAAVPDVMVSVNVSPAQFRSPALLDQVRRALDDSGLAPSRLELEVTEGTLFDDTDAARQAMQRLKNIGVSLALDDFGTGYSSLSYLSRFPFDRLKIDRQFTANLTATGEARAIVQAVIGLGRALGLEVTAEGVETAEQLLLLRADHCAEVQGFHLSPPVPEIELAGLLGHRPERTLLLAAG